MLKPYLMLGTVVKPQGVRGELKLRPITCDPMRFDGLHTVYTERDGAYVKTGIRVTRIAHGIPIGGNLEYVDEMTLLKAMEGRREM